MIHIAIAKYDRNVNACSETRLKSFSRCHSKAWKYFETLANLNFPVCIHANGIMLGKASAYSLEYHKIID